VAKSRPCFLALSSQPLCQQKLLPDHLVVGPKYKINSIFDTEMDADSYLDVEGQSIFLERLEEYRELVASLCDWDNVAREFQPLMPRAQHFNITAFGNFLEAFLLLQSLFLLNWI
jgi:hypothetical protein